ncbi:hypothetical protein ABZ499_34230 [Streptomyces sp. NPDC019990]|uniref:hypothetical protein n=1 Tax=Streptomyces sp. NPDC019990 TaxID=3154693 RepID=UPI00340CF168
MLPIGFSREERRSRFLRLLLGLDSGDSEDDDMGLLFEIDGASELRAGAHVQTRAWHQVANRALRAAPPQAPPPPPTVRQVTGWLTRHPATLSEEERTASKNVLVRCPELDTAAEHVRGFGDILTNRLGTTLPA